VIKYKNTDAGIELLDRDLKRFLKYIYDGGFIENPAQLFLPKTAEQKKVEDLLKLMHDAKKKLDSVKRQGEESFKFNKALLNLLQRIENAVDPQIGVITDEVIPLEELLEDAVDVLAIGLTFDNMLRKAGPIFRRLLSENKCKLRFLLTSPDSAALAEMKNEELFRFFDQEVEISSGILKGLKSVTPDLVKLKYMKFVKEFSMIVVYKSKGHGGRFQMSFQPFVDKSSDATPHQRPNIYLRDTDKDYRKYYKYFLEYAEDLWKNPTNKDME